MRARVPFCPGPAKAPFAPKTTDDFFEASSSTARFTAVRVPPPFPPRNSQSIYIHICCFLRVCVFHPCPCVYKNFLQLRRFCSDFARTFGRSTTTKIPIAVAMDLSPSSYFERHTISPANEVVPFAIGRHVLLNLEKETRPRERDSSRASSNRICDYTWDDKSMYTGRMLSARDRLVAYRLYNNTGEVVRVLDRETRTRHLIKDFRARPVDLQWALHKPLLAVVDSEASLYVYETMEDGSCCNKYLNILRNKEPLKIKVAKVTWCPYIAELGQDHVHLLALVVDDVVEVINISTIKAEIDSPEVDFADLKDIPGAVVRVQLDSPVTAARLSPDSSALVIATKSGKTLFYIVEETELRLAQEFMPIPNQYAEDIVFFDNLNNTNIACYWKYAAIASDNGRRISIFDCDQWNLIGKLRFEFPVASTKLEMTLDSTARYLFVADYDNSNLFCVEIAYVDDVPYFAACTLIAFYNTLYIACPVWVHENLDNSGGFSLDDEEVTNNNMTALFVAISPKSLLEIRVDIERTLCFEPADMGAKRPLSGAAFQEGIGMVHDMTTGIGSSTEHTPRSMKSPEPTTSVPPTESCFSSARNTGLPHPQQTRQPAIDKLTTLMEEKLQQVSEKYDRVATELEKVHMEMENIRSQTRSDLATALESISNELRGRDSKIDHTIANFNVNIRKDFHAMLCDALNQNNLTAQNISDVNRDRLLEVVSNTMSRVVVPSLESLCHEMFAQITEKLQLGLKDFNDQLQRVHSEISVAAAASAAPTPQIPDVMAIANELLAHNHVLRAFELGLKHRDINVLLYICSKIDVDAFFDKPTFEVNDHILLIDLFTRQLTVDTVDKMHILELALVGLDYFEQGALRQTNADNVLKKLVRECEQNFEPQSVRRTARVVQRLATNVLKNL